MTLTEFLLARIAEDEAVAEAASGTHWVYGTDVDVRFTVRRGDMPTAPPIAEIELGLVQGRDQVNAQLAAIGSSMRLPKRVVDEQGEANGRHIAHHDPARVLAECEAKRRIVGLAEVSEEEASGFVYRAALKALCAVYADHPDCDEAWRP